MRELSAQQWSELAEQFDQLSDLPAPERAARLALLQAQQPTQAARLQAMLAADSSAEGLLERSLDAVVPELQAGLHGADWNTQPGQMLGRYRLIEPIGSGGMGEVWRAERADGEYRQVVALKLLKRGMDTQAILRRFLQERSILARLTHPNIVRLLDGGMSDDGRPYYVMEHVAGLSLTAHASAQALDIRARVGLVATIADAVGHAHAQLVVHRDLKPSNVIVDAAGSAHLLDFGIAKLLEETDEQTLTGTGVRVLSPAYAAPEQIRGETVGTAADVYALGLLLFELLTGTLPHRRTSRDPAVLAGGLTQETGEKASQALARAGTDTWHELYGPAADGRRLARELSGDLEVILAKALKPEPVRRYATATAFADDLRRWLGRRPIMARPDSARYRLAKFVRRNRVAVAAAALVLVSLLVGLGAAVWQARIARLAAEQAQRAEASAQQQAQIATAVSDFLTRDVIQSANPYGGTLDIRLAEALIRAGDRIDQRFEGNPRLAGVLHRELASALHLAGETAPAAEHSLRALEGLKAAFPSDDPDLQEARLMHGRVLHSMDRYDEARVLYQEGIAALGAAPAARALLPFQVAQAGLDVEVRREAEAVVSVAAMEPLIRSKFGAFSPLHIDALDHQLRALNQTDRFDEALIAARALRAGTEARFGVGHPLTLKWLQREGQVLISLERYPEALTLMEQACGAQEAALGAQHPASQACRMRQGTVLFELRRFDEAAALIEPVVAYNERTRGLDNDQTWVSWVWLARTLQRRGQLPAAHRLLERAEQASAAVHGADQPQALPYRQARGMFLEQTGQHELALALRNDLLARCERTLPAGHVNIAKYAWDVAETLASLRRDAETVAFIERWLPDWQRLFGESESRTADARKWLERARKAQGGG